MRLSHTCRFSGLLEFADPTAAASAALFNGTMHCDCELTVSIHPVSGVSLRELAIETDLEELVQTVGETRDGLAQLQELIGSLDSAEPAHIDARDQARRWHVERLASAVQRGEQCELRLQQLREESDGLMAAQQRTSVQQQRLDALQGSVLPAAAEWVRQMASMRDELGKLHPFVDAPPPSVAQLHDLHVEWEEAVDALHDATHVEKRRRPPPAAAETSRQARRALQHAEDALRRERARLWAICSVHFPELVRSEPLLRLGAADGDAVHDVLVERELEQYTGPDSTELELLADRLVARHRIYRYAPPHTTSACPGCRSLAP